VEQQGDSPLRREVDDEGRAGRRNSDPSDSEATPSDDENGTVEHGDRVRDAAAGQISDDGSQQRSRGQQSPHPSPASRSQQSTIGSAVAPQVRSIVTKPVQLRLTGGRGRATSGSGVLRLCRPGRDGENSTVLLLFRWRIDIGPS
jgi:hypothetical protein